MFVYLQVWITAMERMFEPAKVRIMCMTITCEGGTDLTLIP